MPGGFRFSVTTCCALVLWACDGGRGQDEVPSAATRAEPHPPVRFVAFGDAGTGSPAQIAVGEAMAQVCAARGCDFALELGDNFYASGVQSVDDAQFESKFEKPYASLDIPIYLALGNHDNSLGPGEGAANERGDYQVEYHYLAGRSSEKFRMPARYYNFALPEGSEAPLAEFFALDSNPLTAIVPDPDPAWNPLLYRDTQQSWLSDALQASNATWKIAFAHHPYLSNGQHGNAGNYEGLPALPAITANGQPWKEMLDATVCAEGVDLMLAGHDHELQWLKPVTSCGKTHFIVSGAAEGPRPFGDPTRNESYWQLDKELGFFWFELGATELTGAAYVLRDMVLPQAGGKPAPSFQMRLPRAD